MHPAASIGRYLYAVVARLVLPARMRARLGADLLDCHDRVMAGASGPAARFRLWVREVGALFRAGFQSRRGDRLEGGATGGPTLGPHPSARRSGGGNPAALTDDLIHAFRSLRRSPGHTLFVIATLGLALGASTAVYSAVRHTLLHPLPYEGADRLVTLWRTAGGSSLIPATSEQAESWGSQEDLVDGSLPFTGGQVTLTGRGEPIVLSSPLIPGHYFRFLGTAPFLGRGFVEEELVDDGPRSVILGYGTWRTVFGGDPAVLGTTVTLDGEPWTVVGVGPRDAPLPTGFPEEPDAFRPLTPSTRVSAVVARLREGVTLEAYQERIDTLVARAAAASTAPSRFGGAARRATQMMGTRLRSALTTLSAAIGLLLSIACLNVSALLINRGDRRRHETAVRVALGVGRARLVRQHLLESLALGVGGGLLGVGLAWAGLQAALSFRPDTLSALDRATLDGPVLLFALGLAMGTSVFFGLLPALRAGAGGALECLRTGDRSAKDDRRGERARWALVIVEVALSFTLLVGSALLVRTMGALQDVDVGYEPEGLVVADIDLPGWIYPEAADREAAWQRIVEAVERLGLVERVAWSQGAPPRVGVFFGTLEVEGRVMGEEDQGEPFFGTSAGPGYFETLGQPIVAGRGFTEEDVRTDADVYIVSESTARLLWPDGGAVGGRMRLGGDTWNTVVGVVADASVLGPGGSGPPPRQLYAPSSAADALVLSVRVGGDTRPALAPLVAALRSAVPDTRVDVTEATHLLGESVGAQNFTMRLFTALASLAALLAAVGLYGVVAQTVGRRTREIGIRMSLGARAGEILWMVLRAGGAAVGIGIAAGIGLSMAGARFIESQLFGVAPGDPASFVAAALVLAFAALLATWIPARRAARIDPVRAITAE